jgi:selenoprotein W-related protein
LEMESNEQLVFSKLKKGAFHVKKEVTQKASNGEPLEKVTNSQLPYIIL